MSRSAVALAAVAVTLLALPSCVERKMVVRSDPPGAMLSLDGRDLEARTPATVPFTFGGTRRVTLTAPGHAVLESTAELADPWYTYFPLDVGAEFLWPFTIHDEQTFDYKLQPLAPIERHLTSEQEAILRKKLADLRLRAAEYRAGGSEGPGRVEPAAKPPEAAPAEQPKPPEQPKPAEPQPAEPAPKK